jgi:hypothetical protein
MKRRTYEIENVLIGFDSEEGFNLLNEAFEGVDGRAELAFLGVEGADPIVRGEVRVTAPELGRRLWLDYRTGEPVELGLKLEGNLHFARTTLVVEIASPGEDGNSYLIKFGSSDLHGNDFTDQPTGPMQ